MVHLYVLHNILVVVVGVALHQVELLESFAFHTSKRGVYLLQQVEYLQALFLEGAAITYAACPVRHHMEGHLLAARLADPKPEFPFLALLVSGGHTQFMKVEAFGKYELLGETLDDAAGEAFDKTAQLLGLPYPGGPAVSALAEKGTPGAVELSRPMIHSPNLDMSFSGLKTSVLTAVTKAEAPNDETFRADLARGFVDAVTDVLSQKLIRAMRMTKMTEVVVAGGVSANKQLRAALTDVVRRRRGRIYFPPMRLCTDNGAMIAAAGLARLQSMTPEELEACRRSTSFGVKPRWSLAGR